MASHIPPFPSPPGASFKSADAMIQNLTDDLMRPHARGTPQQDPPPDDATGDIPDSPLRPPPLTFSPKPQSPRSSPSQPPLASDHPYQWGDYSGTPPVRSPVGSVASHKSKGTTKSRNSVKAPRTFSRASRREPYREGRPLDSPMVTNQATSPERTPSMFSFDETTQPERDFFHIRPTGDRERDSLPQNHAVQGGNVVMSPERTQSNASVNTIPVSMFRDFDGVHLDEVDEEPELNILAAEEQYEEVTNHAASRLEGQSAVIETMPEDPDILEEHTVATGWFEEAQRAAAEEQVDASAASLYRAAEEEVAIPQEPVESENDASSRQASGNRPLPQKPRQWNVPPPQEGMVYYPAPVPMNINLPKRLSQLPNMDIQAQRRSQLLGSLPDDARKSVAWLPKGGPKSPEGSSRGESPVPEFDRRHHKNASNMKNLPPQLRASLFFDQPTVEHKVELKRGSAMLTLEHMLDASTSAPVTAFTGITDAYVPQGHGRSTSMMMADGKSENRLSRGSRLSMHGLDGKSDGMTTRAPSALSRRSKSMDRLNQRGNRTSSVLDMTKGIRLVESEDGLSRLDFELADNEPEEGMARVTGEEQQKLARDEMLEIFRMAGEPTYEHREEDQAEQPNEDEAAEEDEEDIGPPTTLLAELQLRKAKLRERNRTAANAFPNGMHATLLELEAVAQIEKKKRNHQRTALAWEDPNEGTGALPASEDQGDDDVPLGMLFPERGGLINRTSAHRGNHSTMGLMEQRAKENNEPLSARRNRILGIKPAPPPPPEAIQQEEEVHSEHGDETLAQRTRRLRSAKALDEAIGTRDGAHSRAISDDFASEMMSQFGGGLDKKEDSKIPAKAAEPEEETLGQRRKRLQAEALARGDAAPSRIGQTMPMSSLLSSAPVTATGSRNVSGESGLASGSGLLGESELRRMRSRQNILDTNTRSGLGLGLGSTLVDLPPGTGAPQIYTPTAAAARQTHGWGIAPNSFSQGFGAIQTAAHQPTHPRGSMLWAAQQEQSAREASRTLPRQYSGLGGRINTQAANSMPHGQGAQEEELMSPVQRENIDRWRQSVMM